MWGSALGLSVAVAVAMLEPRLLVVFAGDCPLDLSWSNFTLAASTCSDQNERAKCCRYINVFVAVSVARYANTTGQLGVPPALSDICVNSVLQTLLSNGIPYNATTFCGLGPKIQVSYQCEGRGTVLQMLQSPNFSDVAENCKMPLSLENSCRRCLNSAISFLRHLIETQDNVTLNTCRDATFVALANQGDNLTAAGIASCFFGVQGLSLLQVNSSESSFQPLAPAASPSPVSSQAPAQHLISIPFNQHHHTYQLKLVPGIGITITGLAILLVIVLIILIRRKHRELNNADTQMENSEDAFPTRHAQKYHDGVSTMFRRFSYKETKKATNDFRAIIGRGAFGTVYKAQFDDSLIAAVKRLDIALKQSEKDFCQEVELLGRLHHRHLVALKGFCIKRHERFLMYEYMENGSLKDHLHSSDRTPLTWQSRIQIAIDVANALEYLHFYCDPPLCHGDLKSSNILLDKNFLAKVADFGLAHASRSGAISIVLEEDVLGTPGYMDPEHMVSQDLSEKSDMYSYGVLLLQLVTGKQAIHDDQDLVKWCQDFMATDSRLPGLVDPAIADSVDLKQLHVFVRIIRCCTQREVRERPSIKQVLRMLYERLDPVHIGFAQAIEDEEGFHTKGRTGRVSTQCSEVISFSGDAKCLQSSSSTSRSFCSQSVLPDTNSPQSPTGIFSV